MGENKIAYLRWECPLCHDKVISISQRHHCMDTCKCGKTSVDYEEELVGIYSDNFKEVQESMKQINYNFFDELAICMKEQGFKIPIRPFEDFARFPYYYYDYSFIRELEDEMLEELK